MRPHPGLEVLRHPFAFVWEAMKAFRRNQGLLLAGAVAYYTLLSIVPLLILIVFVLSRFVPPGELLSTLTRYLELVAPATGQAVIDTLAKFLEEGVVMSGILLVTLVIFSSLAFTALENAMAVIFRHRVPVKHRRWFVSVVIPYVYILLLGAGLLVVTLVSGALQAMGTLEVEVFGAVQPLEGLAGALLYLIGVAGEILLLTSIYLVMPVGRLSWRHALIGGVTAGLLWEITRHLLVWYFATLSQVQVVYGGFATTIALLLALELAAIVLLLGAQVIAEYERRLGEAAKAKSA